MAILCIKEILETRSLTCKELSRIIDVSEDTIQILLNEEIQITEETATVLKKISEALKIPLVNLFAPVPKPEAVSAPVPKPEAVRLKILDLIQDKGMSLEELSERAGVHPSIIAIYSTQPICKQKLAEPKFQENLVKISEALTSAPEDLQVEADLPNSRLRFREMMEMGGLTVNELSTLTGLPNEFVELLTTERVDIEAFRNHSNFVQWQNFICKFCPQCCKPVDIFNEELNLP